MNKNPFTWETPTLFIDSDRSTITKRKHFSRDIFYLGGGPTDVDTELWTDAHTDGRTDICTAIEMDRRGVVTYHLPSVSAV